MNVRCIHKRKRVTAQTNELNQIEANSKKVEFLFCVRFSKKYHRTHISFIDTFIFTIRKSQEFLNLLMYWMELVIIFPTHIQVWAPFEQFYPILPTSTKREMASNLHTSIRWHTSNTRNCASLKEQIIKWMANFWHANSDFLRCGKFKRTFADRTEKPQIFFVLLNYE